jgi:hypothetical protein
LKSCTKNLTRVISEGKIFLREGVHIVYRHDKSEINKTLVNSFKLRIYDNIHEVVGLMTLLAERMPLPPPPLPIWKSGKPKLSVKSGQSKSLFETPLPPLKSGKKV